MVYRNKMVLSAVFITDLQGKLIISRNYRGDVPITRSIERFAKYIHDTPEEQKKPIFQSDTNSEFYVEDDVGCTGNNGETYVYINVSLFQLMLVMAILWLNHALSSFSCLSTNSCELSYRIYICALLRHGIRTWH